MLGLQPIVTTLLFSLRLRLVVNKSVLTLPMFIIVSLVVLCGYDKFIHKNYDHLSAWIEDRLLFLADVFRIEILGYALVSNRYHAVHNVDREIADNLSDDDVIVRWLKLHKESSH